MDWHELQKKKIAELREMAKEHANVEGTTGLLKEQLVELVAKALHIEKPHLVVEGLEKLQIKTKIRALKADVQAAIQTKDRKLVKKKRRQIHRLKREIHKAAHLTH
ncbi:MAG: Rho termination factor N-terminal domain-containing protein [bacterium]